MRCVMSGLPFSDLSGLMSLAHQRRDLDLRPVILRVQTDLFVTAPSRDRATLEAFESLACGLLPTVDDETATIVAQKLAPLEATPERVLVCLAVRGGAPLCALLEGATRLPKCVIDIAQAVADLDTAISARPAPPFLPLELELDLPTAEEAAEPLPEPTLEELIARARTDGALAKALLEREGLTSADAAALYLDADESRRRQILTDIEALAFARKPVLPRADASRRAPLIRAAAAKNGAAFEVELAAMLSLANAAAWRFDEPARHDLLVFALLAAGVPEEDSVRILLTAEPTIALHVDRVLRLVRLFRTTPRETAAYMVEAILGAAVGANPAGRHQPYIDASGTPARVGPVVAVAPPRDVARRPRRA